MDEFTWIVVFGLWLAFVGLGVGLMSLPPDPATEFARSAFIAGGLILLAKTVLWGIQSHDLALVRILICALGAGLSLTTVVEGWRWVTEKAIDLSKYEGVLYPGNWPMDAFPSTKDFPEDALAIFAASNTFEVTQFPFEMFKFEKFTVLTFDRNQDRSLAIKNLKIFDTDYKILASIDADGFWVKSTARKKRPDKHTLIVFDSSDNEILRLHYLNPRVMSITGTFRQQGFPTVAITKDAMKLGDYEFKQNLFGNNGFVVGR